MLDEYAVQRATCGLISSSRFSGKTRVIPDCPSYQSSSRVAMGRSLQCGQRSDLGNIYIDPTIKDLEMTRPEPYPDAVEHGHLLPSLMADRVVVGGFKLNLRFTFNDDTRIQDSNAEEIQQSIDRL
jgi:hypothetical protein